MIPDCYDPTAQEESRQRMWDITLSKCPLCALCKRRILPNENYHYTDSANVCIDCADELAENQGIFELD